MKLVIKRGQRESKGDPKTQLAIERIISNLRKVVAYFSLPYLYSPAETDPHVAIDVFIKLNTNLAPLKPFDIIVAQMEEALGECLHDLVTRHGFKWFGVYFPSLKVRGC